MSPNERLSSRARSTNKKKDPLIARSEATQQSRSAMRLTAGDCFAALAMTAPLVSSSAGRPPGRGTTRSNLPDVVLRGLDPHIHVFVLGSRRRGSPGETRPRRNKAAKIFTGELHGFFNAPAQVSTRSRLPGLRVTRMSTKPATASQSLI
jgi:hypothetical protein